MEYDLATQARALTTSTLTARPYCRNEHYWQVYFDTNRAISRLFTPVRIG